MVASEEPRSWREAAACLGMDPAVFHPEPHDRDAVASAKAVCAACPVRAVCLEIALAERERYGVWGGLDEGERRRIRLADQVLHRSCRWCGHKLVVTLRTASNGQVEAGGDERNRAFHPACYDVFDRERRRLYKRRQRVSTA
jgi:WhiB family transcriptional regulator, redox-sensing transcriptional regulator